MGAIRQLTLLENGNTKHRVLAAGEACNMVGGLRRSVVKEELWKLTGSDQKATILNHMLYWTQKANGYDRFIDEERSQMGGTGLDYLAEPTHGWVQKSYDELLEETMLTVSRQTVMRHMDFLVKKGWIERRHDPAHKWDRAWQYRVNVAKVERDLQNIGYALRRNCPSCIHSYAGSNQRGNMVLTRTGGQNNDC